MPTQLLDLRRRLGRAPRAAARVLRPARQRRSRRRTSCPASSTTRWASGTARRPVARDARVPARGCSTRRRRRRPARRRPRGLHARRSRRAGRAAAARCRRADSYWARDARGAALRRRRCPTACGSATRPASIPAARSTTSTATRRAGVTPLGRLIDRNYLDVDRLARHPPAQAASRGAAARARCGRLRAAGGRCASSTSPPATAATCSTRSPSGAAARLDPAARLQRAQRRAGQRADPRDGGSTTSRAFGKADAFDRASLAAIAPRPTIGIVSGLYELFPDNALVRASLAGLADAIDAGGYLVYTGQPWHPQLELIARALTSHRGGAGWVMRRRTQAEMDQLVAARGLSQDRRSASTNGASSPCRSRAARPR